MLNRNIKKEICKLFEFSIRCSMFTVYRESLYLYDCTVEETWELLDPYIQYIVSIWDKQKWRE